MLSLSKHTRNGNPRRMAFDKLRLSGGDALGDPVPRNPRPLMLSLSKHTRNGSPRRVTFDKLRLSGGNAPGTPSPQTHARPC